MARLFSAALARGFSPSKLLAGLWPGPGAQGGPIQGTRELCELFVPLGFDFTVSGAPWVKAEPQGSGEAWLGHWER